MATVNGRHISEELWTKNLEHLDSESLFQAGQGLLRTGEDGKDFRMLYRRWHRGKPFKEDLVDEFAHDPEPDLGSLIYEMATGIPGVKAIKLSQAGALVAWSVGTDKTLLRTDVTTCKTRRWFTIEDNDGFSCLDVLNTDGWVFTGGKDFICWDPRQYVFPIFKLNYREATQGASSFVTAMISEEFSGQPRVLTAGDGGEVCLWDVRQTNQIVTRYARQEVCDYNGIECLALEPRHGTLIGGGLSGLLFWDLDTGDPWVPPGLNGPLAALNHIVQSIAVGTERMIVGGDHGVFEWAIPDRPADGAMQLQGVVAVPHPLTLLPLNGGGVPVPHGLSVLPHTMQGMGAGPAGILAGTADESIGMWKCQNNPEQAQQQCDHLTLGPIPNVQPVTPAQLQAPVMWSLKPCPVDLGWTVSCLAATDEIVVNGFGNGKIRIARMKEQF